MLAALALGLGATPAHADVDDFRYDSWQVSYRLGVDEEGRAVAEVTETLTAVFPDFDQNRGIVRALPLSYEKADAAPENISVVDASGAPVPFEVQDEDVFRLILVGDDDFVRGTQQYVISYTLRDVVLSTEDRDEFYWDVVPIERAQPIDAFSAEFAIDETLAARLTGATACFTGPAYSTETCEITEAVSDGGTARITVPAFALPAGSGVTIGIAFTRDSVVQPSVRLPDPLLDFGPVVAGGLGALVGAAALLSVVTARRRSRTARGVVVAQYEVPPELPPLLAAPIVGAKRQTMAAQIVHLAVQGAIRIEDGAEPTGLFGTGRPQPVLRLLDPDRTGDAIDRRTLSDLELGGQPGSSFTIPKKDESFGRRMQQLVADGAARARKRGYLTAERSRPAVILGVIAIVLGAAALGLAAIGFARENVLTILTALPLGISAVAIGVYAVSKHQLHTPLGATAREHLEGVREFIRVAEADRIRMLQGRTTAERRADGSIDVVVLYEKLLPYAILFGLEKEWGRVLESAYRDSGVANPLWYPALGIHGLSHLDRSISSISQSFTTSVSYTSSSSGGTSGGGFSGGGGGGGFSGGR